VTQYVVRRLLQFIPVLIIVTIVVFLMVRMIPGDPAAALLGPQAQPEQIARMRLTMGLEKPLWVQYGLWVNRMLRGDFGESFINGFPISQLIATKLPATLELSVSALAVAASVSVPLGIASALRRGSWPDHLATAYTSLGMAIPGFWLGILLVLLFALKLKVLPPSGYVPLTENPAAGLRLILMPACTLGVYLSAIFARFMKSSILETLHQDYVRTAYSKGLPRNLVVRRHVLTNAMIPVVTVFGIQFGGLLGGAVITEAIFNWPGLGRLLVQSILTRDYGIVQALIMLAVAVYLTVNLCTDIVYGALDPRIRRR
jgi:peptide/nickel transport system permease protein